VPAAEPTVDEPAFEAVEPETFEPAAFEAEPEPIAAEPTFEAEPVAAEPVFEPFAAEPAFDPFAAEVHEADAPVGEHDADQDHGTDQEHDGEGGHVAAEASEADLALLQERHGEVLLESRDDALLPEPLPGEGTSFETHADQQGAEHGNDDAFGAGPEAFDSGFEQTYDHADPGLSHLGAAPEPAAWESEAPYAEVPAVPEAAPAPGPEAAVLEAALMAHAPIVEDDRGSLLKFLSTVKP
jgi:hypothetical protein